MPRWLIVYQALGGRLESIRMYWGYKYLAPTL
nr:MAG TPA: hypothetical protein [Caudoviricetes sp.]